MLYIAEQSSGITDDEVLQEANDRDALLVTADKDFGELVYRRGSIHAGVILLRLTGLSNEAKADIAAEVFPHRAAELNGAFSVISPGFLRVRRSPLS